jgi:hypothetical protein
MYLEFKFKFKFKLDCTQVLYCATMRFLALTLSLLAAAHAMPSQPPPVTYLLNHSNVNSLESKAAVQTGVDSAYLKSLGTTASLDECASRCIAYSPPTSMAASAPYSTRCRSFTRYSAAYAATNASLVGECYAHVDHGWTPTVHGETQGGGGIDSGIVDWPCQGPLDCSLNGKCAADGRCQCRAAWGGDRCETLVLEDVDRAKLGFSPMKDGKNMSSWGGSVLPFSSTTHTVRGNGAASGEATAATTTTTTTTKWHLWASRLDNHCGIGSYLLNSRVVHAVSDSMEGPFTELESVSTNRRGGGGRVYPVSCLCLALSLSIYIYIFTTHTHVHVHAQHSY